MSRMHGSENGNAGRPRGRRERKPRAAAVIAVVALVSLAAVACSSETAERPPSEDQRPGTAAKPAASRLEGPFGQVGGWIAYNDGTGIWAVNPRKAYVGLFAPTAYRDDAVRLAGPAAGDPIAWSADGSRLLVRRGAPIGRPREALFVLDADGTETRVTDSAGSNPWGFGASFSPDGTRVVYAAGDHPSRLEVATVGNAPPEVLLSSEEGHLHSPAFAPDGGRIAFIDGGGDHSNALWVIDADGTNRRKLAGGDWSHVDHLVWSPDGERLAFSCRCAAGTGVYTIRADGTRPSLVSADEYMPMPQWSPDSSQIALVHEDNDVIAVGRPTTGTLVVVGAEGGAERQLARFRLFRVDDQANVRQLTIAWNPAGSPSRSFPTAAFADLRDAPVAEEVAEDLQAALSEMAGGGGMAATVISPEGTWSGAVGKADGVRNLRVNDQFPIASVTKPVIAAQVMQMVEASELDLDDPAAEHLPPDLDFDTNGATIRHLLAHRSGLPDYYPIVYEKLSGDPLRVWTPADLLELVPTRRAPVGEAFEYTDTNYLLLGLVIEQVRGRPVADVLRDGVLDIDGVERLIYQPDERPTEPMAVPGGETRAVLKKGGGYLPSLADATADGPGAAMASDSLSLARWWRAFCAGEIVSENSLTEMTTFNGPDGYGLGLFSVADPYARGVGHTGDGDDYAAWAGCLPDAGLVVVVLSNQAIDDKGGMARPLVIAARPD